MRNWIAAFAAVLALACPAYATVTGNQPPASYACNGSTTSYVTGFPYLATSHLVVTVTTGGAVTTLALTTDYTVSPSIAPSTGTVTLVAGSRCPNGSILTISRSVPLSQPQPFRTGSYQGAAHEQAFDRLAMQIQQNAAIHATDKATQAAKDAAQDLSTTNLSNAVASLATTSAANPAAGTLLVKAFGAVGNGIADDTTKLMAAITAAGVNGTLTFNYGSTYLISSKLLPLAGQTWIGYGATLKRANETRTTLTAPKTLGSPPGTVSVASTTGFWVGQDVTFVSSTIAQVLSDGAWTELKTWTITAIGAGTLTLAGNSPNLAHSYASGDYIVSAFAMIADGGGNTAPVTQPGFKLLGLTLDGNSAGNTTVRRWEITPTLIVTADYGTIRDCTFLNAQSDAVQYIGVGFEIVGNFITNSQGNGIHLANTQGGRVLGNYVYNFSLFGLPNGHQDGGIIASNNVNDTVITGNYVEQGNGYAGIGSWDATDLGVTISGNHLKNVGGGAKEGGGTRGCIEVSYTAATGRAAITGNTVINGGLVIFWGTGAVAVTFTGNHLESTGMFISVSDGVVVSGNSFYLAPPTGLASLAGGGVTDAWVMVAGTAKNVNISSNSFIDPGTLTSTRYTIALAGTVAPLIQGNSFEGMGIAVFFYNAGAAYTSNARVNGNTFRNQGYQVMTFGSAAAAPYGGAFTNNSILQEAGFLTSTIAVRANRGALVSGNTFDLTALAGSVFAIYVSPAAADVATPGPVITNNMIRVPAGKTSVFTDTNARNTQVKANYGNGVFTNTGAEATNTFSDNTTILLP